jgi:ferritin
MSKMDRNLQALKWFEKEQIKDNLEIKLVKDKLINELKGLNKEDLFKKDEPVKKTTIWRRIIRIIWGS